MLLGEPVDLPIRRLGRMRAARLATAAGVVVCWLAVGLADLILSVMFFSDPNPEVLLVFSPMLLAVPWILSMANAQGTVRVHHDALEIRHRRILRRPLLVARMQVERILLDDGSDTGRARFPTGDPAEPLLWTDPVPRRQRADRPLLGDAILPNMAIVLRAPLAMDAARDSVTAVPVAGDIDPPPRRGNARALLLAMEDLDAVRRALGGWPVERVEAAVIPPQVAAAAARVPKDAGAIVALAVVGAAAMAAHLYLLLPVWFAASAWFLSGMIRRRREAEVAARADLAGRSASLTPAQRATAQAAIDVNLGKHRSYGPPS